MTTDVNANIGVNINASDSLAQLKALQRQLALFHTSISRSSDAAAIAQKGLQTNLLNSINAISGFSAQLRTVKSTAESFTHSLENNKFSMREYFRYAGASTKTFGKLFKSEFDTIGKVAEQRVKTLQTQYIKLGRDTTGAMKAMSIIPDQLNMKSHSTQLQIAAQKQALFNQLLKQGSTNLLNFGKNTQWAGRQLMVGFTVPLGMLGAAAAKTFKEMETEAIRFKKVYGDIFTTTEQSTQALQSIQELARQYTKYGVAVSKTVGLAADAAAAGFQGLDLQKQTAEATRLSVLGQIDTNKALQTTITLHNAFNVSSKDLAETVDFLNAVENQTVLSLDDITTAIPKAAPVIKGLGGNVKDLAFFLTAMKEGGVNASEGANALKSGLGKLINPAKSAQTLLRSLGIDINGIVNKNAGNVKQTIIDFGNALAGLSSQDRQRALEKTFGIMQYAKLGALFNNVIKGGTQASKVLDLMGASTQDLANLSKKELAITSDSPMLKFQKAVEDLKASVIPIGKIFLQAVTPVLKTIAHIADKFSGLSDTTKKIITVITIAVAGIGPIVLMAFGLLANGFANILKMFGMLRNGYLRITGQSKMLGEQTNYLTMEQLEAAAAAHSLNQVHATLTQQFTAETGAVTELRAAYEAATIAAANFARTNPGMMANRSVPKKYADGVSMVPGSGSGDTVPAMLTPGEAVIPKDMTKRYAPLIKNMIAGTVQGFARGGFIRGASAGRSFIPASDMNKPARLAEQDALMAELFPHARPAVAQLRVNEARSARNEADLANLRKLQREKTAQGDVLLSELFPGFRSAVAKYDASKKSLFLGMPKGFGSVTRSREQQSLMESIAAGVSSGRFASMPPSNFGTQLSATTGHSFPVPGIGGLYQQANGTRVFVKPVMDEIAALAEQRATTIARDVHGLHAPTQSIQTMLDPTDPRRQRKLIVLVSPYDEAFTNPSGKFSKKEYFQQLVAANLRGDKDLQRPNLSGNMLADVGAAGVFSRASGARTYAESMPSMAEMANINLLGVKGGAKRFFAESTLGVPKGMTDAQYHSAMITEIDRVLPKLRSTISGFNLNSEESKVYQAMINRLEEGKNVDWSTYHAVHSAVTASPAKAESVASILKKQEKDALALRQSGHANQGMYQYAGGVNSVPGSGSGDTVPAMLTPGEAVIPAGMAQKYRPLIRGMIAGNVPGFAKGTGNVPAGHVPTYAEYALRLQPGKENMGGGASQLFSSNQVLAPMAIRAGEASGIVPSQSTIRQGKFDDVAKSLSSIAEKFTEQLNAEFSKTEKQIADVNERFKLAWIKAGQSVENDVSALTNASHKASVRKSLALDEDFYGSAATMPRRAGGTELNRARKSIFPVSVTGVRSYSSIVGASRSLFERLGNLPAGSASTLQLGHVLSPSSANMQDLANNPNISGSLRSGLTSIGLGPQSALASGKKDQEAYNAGRKSAGQSDPYVASRKRNSPHVLAAKDGKDDGVAYQTASNTAIVETQKKGSIASRLRGNTMVAGLAGGRSGMIASSAMMAGSFIPGKAGEIAQKVSMVGFLVQALSALPGPLKILAGLAVAGIGIMKLVNAARERERQAIEGLGNVASISADKAKSLGDFFGIVPTASASASVSGGGTTAQSNPNRQALQSLKESGAFKSKEIMDNISALKKASPMDAKRVLESLGFGLAGKGFAPEAIKLIITAMQEESGKTKLNINFKAIDFSKGPEFGNMVKDSMTQLQKALSVPMNRVGGESFSTMSGQKGTTPISYFRTNKSNKDINTSTKILTTSMNGLFDSFSSHQITLKQLNEQFGLVSQGLLDIKDKSIQAQVLNSMLESAEKGSSKVVSGLSSMKDQMTAYLAISLGVVDANDKIFGMLKDKPIGLGGSADSKGTAEQKLVKDLEARIKTFVKASQAITTATTGGGGGGGKSTIGTILGDNLKTINQQIAAYTTLRKKGVDAETAIELAGNSELATQIAKSGVTKAMITQIADYAKAKKKLADLEAATADPGQALQNNLTKKKAMIDLQEQLINMKYATELENQNNALAGQNHAYDLIQRKITDVQNTQIRSIQKSIDENSYLMDQMTAKEDAINAKYDQQEQTLSNIQKINQDIVALQKSRVSLADALSRGDISAAAQSIMDLRGQNSSSALNSQSDVLTAARKQELLAVGRVDLETKNKQLQLDILKIQHDQIKPLEEAGQKLQDLIDISKNGIADTEETVRVAIEAANTSFLKQFGMTKTSIEQTMTALDLAKTAGVNIDSPTFLQNILNASLGDAGSLKAVMKEIDAQFVAILAKDEALRASLNLPKVQGASQADIDAAAKARADALKKEADAKKIAQDAIDAENARLAALKKAADDAAALAIANAARNNGDQSSNRLNGSSVPIAVLPKVLASGLAQLFGQTGSVSSKGMLAGMALGGLVPKYFATGGFAQGTDTVPAMLTPGEFVMRRNAVDKFGVQNLQNINQGAAGLGTVYNYNLTVKVDGTNLGANDIANAVMGKIRQVESQRIKV